MAINGALLSETGLFVGRGGMAEWSKAVDSRDLSLLHIVQVRSLLLRECGRGFESHFHHFLTIFHCSAVCGWRSNGFGAGIGPQLCRKNAMRTLSVDILDVKDAVKPEHSRYAVALETASEAFHDAYAVFQDPGYETRTGWRLEMDTSAVQIHSRQHPCGKLFSISATLPAPLDVAFDEIIVKFDDLEQWSDNIVFSRKVVELTDHVSVLHYAVPELLVVKSREFLVAQMWRRVGDTIYSGGRSIQLDEVPEGKGLVRASLNLGCGRFRPDPEDPSVTRIDYVISLDLKGFIPKAISNAFMAKLMYRDYETTLAHYQRLARQQ